MNGLVEFHLPRIDKRVNVHHRVLEALIEIMESECCDNVSKLETFQ